MWFTDSKEERKLLYKQLKYLQSFIDLDFSVKMLIFPEIKEFTPCNTFPNTTTLICDIKEILKTLRENKLKAFVVLL